MNKTRFQHLYVQLDTLFRFDCDEDTLAHEVRLPTREHKDVFELSYRDPEGFAIWMAFQAYQRLLVFGACDDEGMVEFSEIEHMSASLAGDVLKRRGELLYPKLNNSAERLSQYELDAIVAAIAHDARYDLVPELKLPN